jgi:type I restriction enzyme S subunit
VPPPEEQRAILAWLEKQSSYLDSAVAQVEKQLDRLREYRQALISTAVTGQIDVSEAAAVESHSDLVQELATP